MPRTSALKAVLLHNLNLADWVIGETPIQKSVQSSRIEDLERRLSQLNRGDPLYDQLKIQLEEARNPSSFMRVMVVLALLWLSFWMPFWLLGTILDTIGLPAIWFIRIVANSFFLLILIGGIQFARTSRQKAIAAGYTGFIAQRALQPLPLYTPFSAIALFLWGFGMAFASWGTFRDGLSSVVILGFFFAFSLFYSLLLAALVFCVWRPVESIWFAKIRSQNQPGGAD